MDVDLDAVAIAADRPRAQSSLVSYRYRRIAETQKEPPRLLFLFQRVRGEQSIMRLVKQ